ncbi:hypothetical protein GALMADRAFT_256575 [Galerina marginata CBS 339.88]|uniref:Uncharacterized protein n=1 Tax=Galerina marginata (strain CBS 339.88) TaxID=685588 RepID=A0A067SFF3_GALM3|nr:hypothetical protein GALMADRAFT_256575 [Galerina marginata CBS 339.88]
MEPTAYMHPAPGIARHIQRLLWMSVGFSITALGFSVGTFSQFSLFITPSAFVFGISHNITLLVLSAKERKQTAQDRAGKLPATATKASIICSWILAVVWCGSFATLIIFGAFFIGDGDDSVLRIVPWFEFAFVVLEIITMVALAVMCHKERRAVASGTLRNV